jgi:hypothetical protein
VGEVRQRDLVADELVDLTGPSVSVAKLSRNVSEVASGLQSLWMVAVTGSRELSPSTTSAVSIWPSSIMLAAVAIPLRKPRQALAMSKQNAWRDSPILPATMLAVAGSR